MTTFRSDISNSEFPVSEKVTGRSLRKPILTFIQKEHPEFGVDSLLSVEELNTYNGKYLSDLLVGEIGQLSHLEKKVLNSITKKSIISDNIEEEKQVLTMGQRIADNVASFGGSWTFIISFGVFIMIWISGNVYWLLNRGFDPYPFILLNLILSCLAALQAPVIMMSQNRQEEKDRERSKNDYMVNLKSELEIRTLHEKIDHLIIHEQREFLEMSRTQIQMLNEIINIMGKK